MAQILRKKDTITVDDMKKEAEREARTMWQFVRTFLKWLVIAGVTGGIGGLVGSAFHLSVNWAATFRAAHPWLLWLLPIGGLLIAAIYRLTKMENKNTNAIIDAIHFGDKVPLLLVPAIYLSTVITHLFGGSAGREGAALQIGGSLGCYVGQLFHLDEKDMRIATLCGMSAVFSALFGTPLTATIFALEVISVGVFYYSALVPCIVASLAALAISNAFGIAPTHFTFALTAAPRLLLLRVAALAAGCSLMSILFCVTMHGTERLFARRIQNTDQSDLQSYVNVIASGLNGAKATVNDMNNYGTVAYTTDDGYTVFDVYLVSENYIYQAELKFLTEKSGDYSMYCSYLENSFASEEGAQG